MILKKRKDFYRNRRRIYLFLGVSRGVGLTSFALSLTNYLSSFERQKVCYLELHERKDVVTMDFDESIVKGETVGYRMNGIDFFPNCNAFDLSCIRKMEYDYIILDLGAVNPENIPFREFDRAFIVGSLCPWKYHEFSSFINSIKKTRKDILQEEFFSTFLTKAERKDFYEKHGLKINELVPLKDPFHLSKEDIKFLSGIK